MLIHCVETKAILIVHVFLFRAFERAKTHSGYERKFDVHACLSRSFDQRAKSHSNLVGAMTSSYGSTQDLDGSDSDATTIAPDSTQQDLRTISDILIMTQIVFQSSGSALRASLRRGLGRFSVHLGIDDQSPADGLDWHVFHATN